MKTLRIFLSGVLVLICMGLYSNAESGMQALNDQYLSDISGQTATVSTNETGFVNFVEKRLGGVISDEAKDSEAFMETLSFFEKLSGEIIESPFAPKFSFPENENGTGVDFQLGGLKLHFRSIDINGTVTVRE